MRKPVILCVDDERMVLSSLKEQIKSRIGTDFQVETAESGEEGLELFIELMESEEVIPLVISDYIMPGMKGDELLKCIHEKGPKTITILLTGQASIEGVTKAINEANLYRYIAKPWEVEDLCLTITEGVNSFYTSRKLESQHEQLLQNNQELIQLNKAFVETMMTALDTRDTITAGHSKRLADYAVKLAQTINNVNYGLFSSFSFSEAEIRELYYAALLHDIGKIGVPETVLLKETRLSKDKQEEIKHRFKYYKRTLEMKKMVGNFETEEDDLLAHIDQDLEFVLEISKRNFLKLEEEKKIRSISNKVFIDFNGETAPFLNDFEVENLTIKKGNLTKQERDLINSHTLYTYNILSKIPWTKELSRVVDIATSHHEKIDGSGYHNQLKDVEISLQAKILAILDIYEALTATDRPYKPPMPPAKVLSILEEEVSLGYLDKDIFDIFVKYKVYELHGTV